jgi:formate dehydrogenase major subunit
MYVAHRAGQLMSVRPALDAAVNKGHLCVKGRYGWDFVRASDRITQPMIRIGNEWKATTWNHAVEFVAGRLHEIIARCGPDAVGVLGSARATNEENYLAQKFARVVIGTNNIDCCARVCHAPTAAGMKLMLGTGAATNSFDDIELARSFLICGANPTENHPIVGDRIRQAVLRGAELIIIDPRQIDLSAHARVHLQLRSGTNVPLINAIANVIVEEGLYDANAAEHLDAWREFREFIAVYSPERVANTCRVNPALIREAARVYATCRPAMCFHGLGITEHVQGTHGVMCLVNLALLTGNIGRPGSGINPLRGQNNVQGAAQMGCDPDLLTGGVAVAENRARFSAIWKSPVPAQPGLNLLQMMDAAKQGRLSALWVMGYDIALTNPNATETRKALQSLELLVVQDLFLNETARIAANVFLPTCSAFEKEGTFMNSERRVQRIRKVIEPIGESKSDAEIISLVASSMGHNDSFHFQCAEAVWNEIRSVWPDVAGITYHRLDERGLQWPCPTEDHPGTGILHAQIFANGSRLRLQPIEYSPTPERTSEVYPLLLVTGRALYQFNSGTMTDRSRTALLQPEDVMEISPADAKRYGIADGQRVWLRSQYGETTIRARISNRVSTGELFATFQSPRVFPNLITGPHRDRFVQTPEFKVTAVAIEPISENGEASSNASEACETIG